MSPTLVHSLVQTLALLVAVTGLYLVTSLGWALLVGGGVVFGCSFLAELGRPHPAVVRRAAAVDGS
jgi:hypothetical protein